MRILHVTDVYRPRVGGIEMFVEELATRQAAAGHEVAVLSPTRAGPDSAAGPLEIIRVPTRAPVTLPLLPWRDLRLSSYDVVHSHLSVVSPFATRVAKAAVAEGVPTVATVHSMWTGREGWIRIVGAIAGWARWPVTWTAVSSVAAAAMQGPLGADAQVHVVPNGVDVHWWREHGPSTSPQRPVTFVAVMRLAGRKRPLPLIEVLARVRAQVPAEVPLRAVIVGEGPQGDKLRALVDELGVGDWVDLAGGLSREEIRELYRDADAYLAPSHQESFGLAALEARSAGLPVVAMRSGGVGEFVRHEVEGFICHDDDEMVTALTRLACDRVLRHTIAGHNQTHPPALDWSVPLDGFAQAYATAERALTASQPRRSRLGAQRG